MESTTREVRKNMENINIFLENHRIDELVTYVQHLPKSEQKETTDYLLSKLKTSSDGNSRNMLAIILSDLKCQDAVEILMELISKPELENNRGSLVYALENLECAKYYKELLPLLFKGNFEVRMQIYSVMQNIFPQLCEQEQKWCIDYVERQLEEYECILSQAYDLYENVIGGELSE